MTLMKGAPVANFNATIRELLRKSLEESCQVYEIDAVLEDLIVRRSMMFHGDYLAGIRVRGQSFQGTVTLAMDKLLAKSFADKIFAGAPTKADDSMLCDLVGEVCNQVTGAIQRALGKLGCKMHVTAQESMQISENFEVEPMPDEWLLVPFRVQTGRGVLGFGCVGEIGLGQDSTQEEITDTRQITFF